MKYKKDSNFIWTDLSCYEPKKGKQFYSKIFDWEYYDDTDDETTKPDKFGMEEVSYFFAMTQDQPVSGIYDMPPFFRKIKMPSFWMSYLSVVDIHSVVKRAKNIEGTIVEIEPTPFGEGEIALIRDPAGAGFTVYEGPSIDSKGTGKLQGQMIWNELIVDSVDKVKGFYQEVFGFKLQEDPNFNGTRYKVLNPNGKEIAGIEELPEAVKGEKVYWVPFFAVRDLNGFTKSVKENNGEITYQDNSSLGNLAIVADPLGASFGVMETSSSAITGFTHSNLKWRSTLAFVLIWIAVLMNFSWVWGIIFLIWLWPDIKNRETYLLEYITESSNPILYWAIILSWIFMSFYLIFS